MPLARSVFGRSAQALVWRAPLLCLCLLAACAAPQGPPGPPTALGAQQALEAVTARIRSDFLRPVTDADLAQPTAHALAASLRPPGRYFTAAEWMALQQQGRPALSAGIGVRLAQHQGQTTLVPHIGGSADAAGLRPGDALLAVDQQATAALTLTQAAALLAGVPDSTVRLTIQRGTEAPRPVDLVRQSVATNRPRISRPDADTLVLGITAFSDDMLVAAPAALAQAWQRQPFKGVVLDLRRSPGGLLSTSIGLASMFLPADTPVGRTMGRTSDANQSFKANKADFVRRSQPDPLAGLPKAVRSLPLVVLVDEESGSGAEFLAAALQDARRATIVGRRTAGRGQVETVFPMPGGGALQLTTASWLSPAGMAIQDRGVQPEQVLDASDSATELRGAVAVLQRLIQGRQ
jgi:carboxyl-terminal processing protease